MENYAVICYLYYNFRHYYRLYHLQMEPFLYAFILSLSVSVVFIMIDYFFYQKKIKQVDQLLKLEFIDDNLLKSLKDISHTNCMLDYYRKLIEKMITDRNKIQSKWDIEKTEMVDYYTL